MADLTLKEERFCVELGTGKSQTKQAAAIAAGFSEKSAGPAASRLLRNVKVKARIKEIQREVVEKSGYDAVEIKKVMIRKLMNIVMADPSDFMYISKPHDANRQAALNQLSELNGGQAILDFGEILMIPTAALTPEVAAAIKSMKLRTASTQTQLYVFPEIEMHDPIQAAKLLSEITGIKAIEGNVNVNLTPSKILDAVERRTVKKASNDDADRAKAV